MRTRPIPAAAAAAALIPLLGPAHAADGCPRAALVGTVTAVRDGTTIDAADVPIRLQGVVAPEWSAHRHEPGGRAAKRAMRALVLRQEVRCEPTGERRGDRCVAVCYLGGTDIAAALVRAGLARDCPRFSGGRYADEEREAAREGATIRESYALPGYCRRR